jgi:hypothetical protein
MLTLEQALKKARAVKPNINRCTEFKGAYAFFFEDSTDTDGGDSPVVITKDTGEALNFVSYAVKHGGEVVRQFDVQ